MRLLHATLLVLTILMACPAQAFWTSDGTPVDSGSPSATARANGAFAVDAMLVGNQVLHVADTRQLSLRAQGKAIEPHLSPDGKYVVYLIADQRGEAEVFECRLAKVSTGKTITVLSRVASYDREAASKGAWTLDGSPGIAWAPDSSVFALKVTHLTSETGKRTQQQFITVYAASGAFKKAIPLDSPTDGEEHCQISQSLHFTPDSRQILASLLFPDLTVSERIHPLKPTLRLFDISTGRSRDISAPELTALTPSDSVVVWSQMPVITGWSSDGRLLLMLHGDGKAVLHKISLDGKSDESLTNTNAGEVWSSDGAFAMVYGRGLPVRTQQVQQATPLIPGVEAEFQAWTPNNKMILYSKSESIGDVSKSRKREFKSLWLSTIDPAKPDSLCVALDAEDLASASRDCRSIAYVSQGQLYVAELALREPRMDEKLACGLPLNEEEKRIVVLMNGKQIANAILMYGADNNEALPPADSVASAIANYVQSGVFCRPGTDQNIFRYIDPGVSRLEDIERPADTIIGELDLGDGSRVCIFADGHVRTEPKQ